MDRPWLAIPRLRAALRRSADELDLAPDRYRQRRRPRCGVHEPYLPIGACCSYPAAKARAIRRRNGLTARQSRPGRPSFCRRSNHSIDLCSATHERRKRARDAAHSGTPGRRGRDPRRFGLCCRRWRVGRSWPDARHRRRDRRSSTSSFPWTRCPTTRSSPRRQRSARRPARPNGRCSASITSNRSRCCRTHSARRSTA